MRRMVALALLLAGCDSSQSALDEALPRYQGKSVDLVFLKWGTPTQTVKGDGGMIYLWQNVPPARDCRVEAHADDRGNVIGIRGNGTEGACATWMRLL